MGTSAVLEAAAASNCANVGNQAAMLVLNVVFQITFIKAFDITFLTVNGIGSSTSAALLVLP